jgi:predicted NBD/HSP70 family sugar kinase
MTPAPGTPRWLRSHNDAQALGLLFERGPLTRADLGTLTGLSKPTAAQMVTRLERLGLVEPAGSVPAARGPQAVTYTVRTDRARGLAMDVREDTIEARIVDVLDADHPVISLPVGQRGRGPGADVRAALAAAAAAAEVDPRSVTSVVVGVQAAVDDGGDRLDLTDTLPGWPSAGARKDLEDTLRLQVVVENDVNLAAIGERAAGAGQDVHDFALVWLGEGVGVAVDVAGALHRGARGGAGEIGYLSAPREAADLDPDAEDLTEVIGGRGVRRLLTRFGAEALPELLAGKHGAAAIDALAARISLGVAPVVAVLDPERIILGGPIGAAGGRRLAAAVADRLAATSRWRTTVVAAALTEQPVLAGARHQVLALLRTRLLDIVASTTADPQERTLP